MGTKATKNKYKYNNANYIQVQARLEKELVERWEKLLKEKGIAKAEFLRKVIQDFLDKETFYK